MDKTFRLRPSALAVLLVLLLCPPAERVAAQAAPDPGGGRLAEEIAALREQNAQLRALIPSQSHAMQDVAYHFTNLWFAGQRRNWPLAQFYFNEARNHILWAIRIVPVRKNGAAEVRLGELFEAIDSTALSALQKQIGAQDRAGFSAAYKDALAGCNACHVASGKPFLHIVVPDRPEAHLVDFNPH